MYTSQLVVLVVYCVIIVYTCKLSFYVIPLILAFLSVKNTKNIYNNSIIKYTVVILYRYINTTRNFDNFKKLTLVFLSPCSGLLSLRFLLWIIDYHNL